MKCLLLTISLFNCCLSFGQTFRKVDESLNKFIVAYAKSDSSKNWIKNIISNRDTFYLRLKLENTLANKIKIVEVFDIKTKKYGIKEEYIVNDKIEFIYRDQQQDTFYNSSSRNYKYSFEKNDGLKSGVVYFPPNTINALCGCGQVTVKIRRRCFKEAEKRAKKDGFISENFGRLITYIDKASQQITFILELPASGKRKVSYGFSPNSNNRNWYD